MTDIQDILAEIRAEEAKKNPSCSLCDYIASLPEDEAKALSVYAAGTIGLNKLAAIFARHNLGIGRRTITAHRREKHWETDD